MSVAVVRDRVCLRHSNGSGHPERAERLEALDRLVDTFARRGQIRDVKARDAQPEELGWIHDPRYVAAIQETSGRPFTVLETDTAASADTYASALRAAGATLAAVDSVMGGRNTCAFALVRPPGHHAERDRAMGFCLFNNVAVAASYARRRYGLERILILDWDVHHGNGTMHSFYGDPTVLYASLHQYPHYPGTGSMHEVGAGKGEGYTVNVPLPPGQSDADYVYVFRTVLVPVFRAFAPQLVLVSAGFDADARDPLADMRLTSACFGAMTLALREVASVQDAPLVLVLEGGYSITALTQGVGAVLEALLSDGDTTGDWWKPEGPVTASAVQVVSSLKALLEPHWPCLRGAER